MSLYSLQLWRQYPALVVFLAYPKTIKPRLRDYLCNKALSNYIHIYGFALTQFANFEPGCSLSSLKAKNTDSEQGGKC